MSHAIPEHHPLHRLFRGLVEHAFVASVGIGDPRVTSYVSELLARFAHMDRLYPVRAEHGGRLEELAEILLEAQAADSGSEARRELHRHIGDVALFWTGVYPEAVRRFRAPTSKDHFLDYCEQGKRAYYIASTYADAPYDSEAPVLRRLSVEFELCAYGLNQVRREMDKLEHEGLRRLRQTG